MSTFSDIFTQRFMAGESPDDLIRELQEALTVARGARQGEKEEQRELELLDVIGLAGGKVTATELGIALRLSPQQARVRVQPLVEDGRLAYDGETFRLTGRN